MSDEPTLDSIIAAQRLIGDVEQQLCLSTLLEVEVINQMYGRMGGTRLFEQAINYLETQVEIAGRYGNELGRLFLLSRLPPARYLLEVERKREAAEKQSLHGSLLTNPADADSRMSYEGGQSSIVLGDGHRIVQNGDGESRYI